MAINFPSNPVLNQVYSYAGPAGTRTWFWNGTAWQSQGTSGYYFPDIVPLDNLQYQFDGIENRFYPTNGGIIQSQTNTSTSNPPSNILSYPTLTNPFSLLLTLNGILQNVGFPEVVWGTPFSYDGFTIDSDGYIAFSEVPPAGSTFIGRIQVGPAQQITQNTYPFRAMDILLGAY
jgi:hypothetical protein